MISFDLLSWLINYNFYFALLGVALEFIVCIFTWHVVDDPKILSEQMSALVPKPKGC